MSDKAVVLEFDLPCNDQSRVDQQNEIFKTFNSEHRLKTFEEHLEEFLDKTIDVIYEVGDNGGWFIGDGIKVKLVIEYDEQNK